MRITLLANFFLCACSLIVLALFSAGYIYPALLIALVPVRIYIVSRILSVKDLEYLDPSSESAEEFMEEQALIEKALRMESDTSGGDNN